MNLTHSLKEAAERLGVKHRALMKQMREKGLLDQHNLPANPEQTKLYLVTRENRWYSDKHGWQYPRVTRVTAAGIPWLADKLSVERPMPPAQQDPRDVA